MSQEPVAQPARRKRLSSRVVLWAFLIGGLLALVAFAFWVLPSLFVRDDPGPADKRLLDARSDLRIAAVQILGFAAVLIGAVLTFRHNWEQRRIDRDAQTVERYTRAVEQLGHERRSARVAGAYSLGVIARTSREDHGQVVDVLQGYIRAEAPLPELRDPADVLRDRDWEARCQTRADVQAAMTVLGRRNRTWDDPDVTLPIRLSRVDLRWIRARRLDFSHTHFIRSDLTKARLSEATLVRTNFRDAILVGATFDGARLRHAKFKRADLRDAKFRDSADLTRADLTGAILDGADFTSAIFDRTIVTTEQLSNAVGVTDAQRAHTISETQADDLDELDDEDDE